MGGTDKGLMTLAGRPMIAHAIERLRPQVATLAISANGDSRRFAPFGLPVLADDPPDFSGPLAGALAGLEFCARAGLGLTHVATLPGDTPFAPEDFVARLHAARSRGGRADRRRRIRGPDASRRRALAGRDRRRPAARARGGRAQGGNVSRRDTP